MIRFAAAVLFALAVTAPAAAQILPPEFGQTHAVEGDHYEDTTVNVYLTMPQALQVPLSLRVFTTPITARPRADYDPIDKVVTWRAGERTVTLPVTIRADEYDEEDETFRLSLEGTDSTAVFVIEDDDEPNDLPWMSIDGATVFETTGEPTMARFRVSLSAPGINGATVRYSTHDLGAEEDVDYRESRGILRFEPGQVVQWLEIEVMGDADPENDEFFQVELRDATGANLDREFASGAIRDDDAPGVRRLWVHDAVAVERTDMISYIVFRLELTSPSTEPIDVPWAAADVDPWLPTARRGRDFEGVLSSIRFNPGETLKEIPVAIFGDAEPEPDEYLGLYVGNAAGIHERAQPGTGVIVDDDREWAVPRLRIDDVRVVETDDWSGAQLRLTLASPPATAASVTLTTRALTAETSLDFEPATVTVHFEPGQVSQTVTLRVRGDDAEEGRELFAVDVSGRVGLAIVRDEAFISIDDDDAPLTRRRSARR